MASDDRVATVFLALSVLLHLGLLTPLILWRPRETPPQEEKLRATYVVRIPQPSPAMTSASPPPVPGPPPRPELPTAAVQPRQPQPLERPQQRQEPTPVPQVMPQIKPVEPERADRPLPRQPAALTSQATAVRRQKLPQLPKVAPSAVKPLGVETANRPVPRQPSTRWQQHAVPQQQARAPAHQDPLMTYLAEVRAAIERHKRYPTAARRAGIIGSVVLQFVILPDGRVVDPAVAESNGYASFGTAALESLRRAGRMPPFPEAIDRDRLVVQVPISYKLSE